MEKYFIGPEMADKWSKRRSNLIMFLIYRLYFTFLLLNLCHQKVSSSGVFEFRLISFINDFSRDAIGNCCGSAIKTDNNNEICSEKCQTFFRVCLKHYQTNIDPSPPCTFGEVITTVYNDSSVYFKDNTNNGQNNTIKFPFNFSWPGTFSLIVEAWHNASASTMSTTSRGRPKTMTRTLITRLAMSRYLKVDNKWTQKSAHNNQTTLNYWYRVTCQENYFGEYCGALCKPRDDKYGHFTCGSNGEKICLPGWNGNYCEKAVCRSGCNATNGECFQPNECNCRYGWEGHNCNQCTKYPGCLHGYCIKPWDCLCDEGWGGLLCNQDLNYCTNHKPCKNGGSCTNTGQGWYTCECPLGFTGKNCEQEIDSCAHLPCANGATCNSVSSNNYTCECPLGYFGKHCETMASVCTNNPCSNDGTCVDGPSGYLCICKVGYEGDNCQIKQTDCDPNPCTNGGSCVTTDDDDYKCICRAGFAGDNCEVNINDCDVNPCFNSGTCIDEINSFRCMCVPGFIGDLCQDNVDDCLVKPCSNGGTCIDMLNDYQCRCAPGYAGKDCSLNVNECESNPCLNGGVCEDGIEEYVCKCSPNYSGKRCEHSIVGSINLITYENSLNNSTHLPMTVLSGERAEPLSSKQLIVIVLVSVSVPMIALIAAISIMICKHRKNREEKIKRKDEDEVRRQNEQNLVTSLNNKCGLDSHIMPSANVIVNALDRPPSLNHLNRGKSATLSKLTNHDIYDSKQNMIYSNRQLSVNEKSATLQSLKKTKSNNKLLNTECTAVNNRSDQRPASKLIVENLDHNVVNQSPNPKQECIENNTIERRGSLTHPQSVPNSLAKSESSINNSTIAVNRTIDSINSHNNLHNNINIAAQMHRHRASGRSNHSIYVIEDHYSQPTYATIPDKLYATEV